MGGGAGLGIGGLLLLGVLSLVFKRDLITPFLNVGGTDSSVAATKADPKRDAAEEPMVQFVSFVLDDAQKTWAAKFASQGKSYQHARLVLFRDGVDSACGSADSAVGPFYCPGDKKVYIDLGFYDELKRRFGASGDFAQAYVLAHEIGHHVQNLQGVDRQVRQAQQQNPSARNPLSVKLELQADCYAGVWANSTNERKLLEAGDVEEALRAASAIGDDNIQKISRGRVVPESFTHGSSEQRVSWFRRGFESGDPNNCNTFGN
jgi:predicted metalloprotease